MGNFKHTESSFSNGEVSPEFFARDGLNGLSKLENMDVLAGGGLTRRRGLKRITTVDGDTRLIPFSVSEGENYLLALTDERIRVYHDGVLVNDLLSPWGANDLNRLQYAQRFGTIIFVHPDYRPQILKKNADRFDLSVFGFSCNDDMTMNIPFMKFDDADGIKITITAGPNGNNSAKFTTDSDFWTPDYVGENLLVVDKQWTVTEYISPTEIMVLTNNGYTLPTAPVSDWMESAFGKHRGWPVSISFHQDRLVFGGSRSWPSGVWMSKVGQHNNFDVGTGLDDEAIFITLLSEQRQQICTVVSSDNLQILTTVGEWAISNKPLTPSSVNIKQHTSVGSIPDKYLPPQKIEGGTVFIAGSGRDIRELSLDELGENYNANDLCALSKHLMNDPIDLAYNDQTNQLFVVLSNGDMAVLNKNSVLGISAWGIYKTQGWFESVAVMDGSTYVSVRRGEQTYIEKFDLNEMIDSDEYGFSFTAIGLPMLSSKHAPDKIRIRKISARVLNTKSLFINGLRASLPNEIYTNDMPGFSGDVSINVLGTKHDTMQPVWCITGNEPLPTTVLSITTNGWYQI